MSFNHQGSVAKLFILFSSCSYLSFISQYVLYSSFSTGSYFLHHSFIIKFPSYQARLWSSIWSHVHSCRILPGLLYPHIHFPVGKNRCSNCFFLWSMVIWFWSFQFSLMPSLSGASSGSYHISSILSSKVMLTSVNMIPAFIRNISVWVQWVGVRSLLVVMLIYMSYGMISHGPILFCSVYRGFSSISNSMAYMS